MISCCCLTPKPQSSVSSLQPGLGVRLHGAGPEGVVDDVGDVKALEKGNKASNAVRSQPEVPDVELRSMGKAIDNVEAEKQNCKKSSVCWNPSLNFY